MSFLGSPKHLFIEYRISLSSNEEYEKRNPFGIILNVITQESRSEQDQQIHQRL